MNWFPSLKFACLQTNNLRHKIQDIREIKKNQTFLNYLFPSPGYNYTFEPLSNLHTDIHIYIIMGSSLSCLNDRTRITVLLGWCPSCLLSTVVLNQCPACLLSTVVLSQ